MKRIIYIAVILMGILPFFGKELQSSCFAQSMASESLWDKADETGYYGKHRCDSCGVFIEGYSEEELELNMAYHMWDEHTNWEDDSYNDDNTPIPEEENNHLYINVINIEDVAAIAQQIGLDDKQTFLNKYYCYGYGYLHNNVIYLSNFIKFIENKYGAIRHINFGTVTSLYNKYFIITTHYISSKYQYYKILTRYNTIDFSKSYEYIYTFK